MRVLLLGASGPVGTAILDHLGDDDRYQFTVADKVEHSDYPTEIVDARDYDDLRPLFEDQDAVVQMALRPGSASADDWEVHFDNLRIEANAFRAAHEAGVETVVYASTNHVVGAHEDAHAPDIYYDGPAYRIDHTAPVQPDSLYGVGKAYAEALGRYLVEYKSALARFLAVRIGTVRHPPYDHPYVLAELGVENGDCERGDAEYERRAARGKATWLSRRDLAHLVDCCLRTDATGFEVFYGVSGNQRRWFDIDHARDVIGYDPLDDGEEWDAPPG